MMNNDHYDVCVICALYEEAQAFLDVLKTHGAHPEERYSQQLKRNFFSASIQNNAGEPLNILVTWAPDMGGIDTNTELGRLLATFPIRFAAMTGICAGNKNRVALGDLVVAESTYLHDSGSYISTADGGSKQLFNTRTIQVSPTILQFARGFEGWQDEGLQLARPASKRQQTDWLLNTLLEKKNVRAIDPAILTTYAPKWRSIVQELRQGETPFLDAQLQLNEALVMDLLYGPEEFPYHDPLTPTCHIGAMASGNSVRKDNPFPAISQPVSKVLGLDMECWAFYHTLQERHNIYALFVKGVCDYGDSHKDDSYHHYAATLSAIYMHAFIKKFVTEERMPWPADQQPAPTTTPHPPVSSLPIAQPAAETTTPSSATNGPDKGAGKKPIKVFLSYSQSPTDERLINELNKHLILLERHKSIESWYRDNIYAGDTVEQGVEEKMKEAQIILLLITPDYLSSPLYNQEYQLIQACYHKGATVIPVRLRTVPDFWKDEFYGELRPVPGKGPFIASLKNQDEAMAKVAEELRAVVQRLAAES